jgi:hypothetical protein
LKHLNQQTYLRAQLRPCMSWNKTLKPKIYFYISKKSEEWIFHKPRQEKRYKCDVFYFPISWKTILTIAWQKWCSH